MVFADSELPGVEVSHCLRVTVEIKHQAPGPAFWLCVLAVRWVRGLPARPDGLTPEFYQN
jgi:hypothetical protein